MQQKPSKEFITERKRQLQEMKQDILNRIMQSRKTLAVSEKQRGDEADRTVSILAEEEFVRMCSRFRERLQEIEQALARIERGVYGICEETDDFIELKRLEALPWTRVSVEGAELRDSTRPMVSTASL